jgi:non-homologous end joining protein Ku
MKAKKAFDCVAMKDEIQRNLRARYRHMTAAEEAADMRRRLAVSRSPIGELWRRLQASASQQSRTAVSKTA